MLASLMVLTVDSVLQMDNLGFLEVHPGQCLIFSLTARGVAQSSHLDEELCEIANAVRS